MKATLFKLISMVIGRNWFIRGFGGFFKGRFGRLKLWLFKCR